MTGNFREKNRLVQGLWIGPQLSPLEELSIRSFLANGHEYHLYAYGHVSNVPEGTVVKDANAIIPFEKVYKYRDYDSYSGFSNHFRYRLLQLRGGWWVDMDLICLKPFDFESDHVFSSEDARPSEGSGRLVNVGAIKVPVGSPLMEHMWKVCESKDPSALVWGEIGPRLFAESIGKFGLESHVREPTVFCPVAWFDWQDIVDPDKRLQFPEETHAVHLWNEMWRRAGFAKDDRYDPACLYERMLAAYGARSPVAEREDRGLFRAPAPVCSTSSTRSGVSPSVSALVLSKNGSGRLARCLESIRQTGFADEIVVCVDAETTDSTFRLARTFTPNVHVVRTAGNIESVLAEITALCSCDFVLRIDDDESLAGNWDKASFGLLATYNRLTHFWVPTRWVVPPGDAFIASAPWYPNPHPRLHLNAPGRITWPKNVHGHMSILGHSLFLYDRWINHYTLVDRPKGERRRRCARYRQLNPSHDPFYYLYEDQEYSVLPWDATAIEAADRTENWRLPASKKYTPNELVDFSFSGNCEDYLGTGWGQPEEWGAWTVGPEAEICLPLTVPLHSGAVVAAEVAPYLNAKFPALQADVLYRDTFIARWVFDRPGFASLSANLPADFVAGDAEPRFQFRIADPRSPVEAGESGDSRLLGLGFKSLRLQLVEHAAAALTPREAKHTANGLAAQRPSPPAKSCCATPKAAFVERAIDLGRRALPGRAIDVFWEGMWIFRVDSYYFPAPDVAEPDGAFWRELEGLAARYLKDAEDYWYYGYRPKPGDTVVDVGAGRGEDTLAFSRCVEPGGRVIAIEPHPVSFSVLQKFCAWNELANVTALNFACVSRPGRLQIETLPNWQSNYVMETGPTPTSFPVEGVTVDYLCTKHGIERIDLLKMNIEGAERDALPGARMALERARHVCIAAHDFRADRGEAGWFRTGGLVRRFLRDCGFNLTEREDPRAWARDHIHGWR